MTISEEDRTSSRGSGTKKGDEGGEYPQSTFYIRHNETCYIVQLIKKLKKQSNNFYRLAHGFH
jgi:hypothetical protein